MFAASESVFVLEASSLSVIGPSQSALNQMPLIRLLQEFTVHNQGMDFYAESHLRILRGLPTGSLALRQRCLMRRHLYAAAVRPASSW